MSCTEAFSKQILNHLTRVQNTHPHYQVFKTKITPYLKYVHLFNRCRTYLILVFLIPSPSVMYLILIINYTD